MKTKTIRMLAACMAALTILTALGACGGAEGGHSGGTGQALQLNRQERLHSGERLRGRT